MSWLDFLGFPFFFFNTTLIPLFSLPSLTLFISDFYAITKYLVFPPRLDYVTRIISRCSWLGNVYIIPSS